MNERDFSIEITLKKKQEKKIHKSVRIYGCSLPSYFGKIMDEHTRKESLYGNYS